MRIKKEGGEIKSKKQALKFANLVSKMTQKSYDFRRKGNPDILMPDLPAGRLSTTVQWVQEGFERQTLGLSLEEDGKAYILKREIERLMNWHGNNQEIMSLKGTDDPNEPYHGVIYENLKTHKIKIRPHEKHEGVYIVIIEKPKSA